MSNEKTVVITLVKSLIGRNPKHIITAKTLGLTKVNKSVEHKLTAPIQGMINKIDYLVKVESN